MNAPTLVSHYSPLTRARARRMARAERLLERFVVVAWFAVGMLSTFHFFTWLEIVR